MALHNKYDITKLEPNDGTVEAVRVTFHDYDIDEGLEFVKKVMEKGYKCFCNPINIMGYSDQEILNLIQKINQIKPYAFSIVDTFGSMIKSDLLRIYSLLTDFLCGLLRALLRHFQEGEYHKGEVSFKLFFRLLQLHLRGRYILSVKCFESADYRPTR